MGLNEKRKIKEYQDSIVPERQKELAGICGSTVPYEIDWESFSSDLEALNFLDNLSFHRINMAFRVICVDDLARDSIRANLKTIKLRNVKEKKDMKLSFSGGVLEMHLAYALRTDGMYSDTEIKNLVINGL